MTHRGNTRRPISRFCLVPVTMLLVALLGACSGGNDRITSYGLTAEGLTISREKDGPAAAPRDFHPGDEIHIRFSISDFQLDTQGNLWIQEDLIMNDPAGTPVLERQNLLDDRVPPPEGMTEVPVHNVITLFDTAQPGTYMFQINVRDKVGGGAVYIEAEVTVQAK